MRLVEVKPATTDQRVEGEAREADGSCELGQGEEFAVCDPQCIVERSRRHQAEQGDLYPHERIAEESNSRHDEDRHTDLKEDEARPRYRHEDQPDARTDSLPLLNQGPLGRGFHHLEIITGDLASMASSTMDARTDHGSEQGMALEFDRETLN